MNAQELDELLRGVRVFNAYARTNSLLSDEQRGAIARAILPEINRRIEQAKARET